MTPRPRVPSRYQRNALAPALIAAATLFVSPLLIDSAWWQWVLFIVSILAVIVGWFALQARQWWWMPVFIAIAVLWNPVAPFAFTGPVWQAAQPAAALTFLIAGSLIKVIRPALPRA